MVKNLTAIAGDVGLISGLGRFPTPLFFPGKSQGQRSLVAYSPWCRQRVRHDLATKQQIKLKKTTTTSTWRTVSRTGLEQGTKVFFPAQWKSTE